MSEVSDAARQLAALGASKGGRARAARLTSERRSEIAREAARSRWGNRIPVSRREYAVVTPEVKEWMDANPDVAVMLAKLCASPDRDTVMSDLAERLR